LLATRIPPLGARGPVPKVFLPKEKKVEQTGVLVTVAVGDVFVFPPEDEVGEFLALQLINNTKGARTKMAAFTNRFMGFSGVEIEAGKILMQKERKRQINPG
jgi:hypothetical protein